MMVADGLVAATSMAWVDDETVLVTTKPGRLLAVNTVRREGAPAHLTALLCSRMAQ